MVARRGGRPAAARKPRTMAHDDSEPQCDRSLKRAAACASSNSLMPSIFAVALAGAELGARPRRRASKVDEIVMAAVPARPAARPFPTALATFPIAFMT